MSDILDGDDIMSKSIALLVGGNTHTFTYDRTAQNGEEIFTAKSGTLVGRMRIRARLNPNRAGTVNRISLALDVPKVLDGDGITAGVQPKVAFTQVWSHDVSVVTGSDEADRIFLADLTSALIGSTDVRQMVINASNLSG